MKNGKYEIEWAGHVLCDELSDHVWLFRGVPTESPEVADVDYNGEIRPPRPDRSGEYWIGMHCSEASTETAYTSWTTNREIAVDAALRMSDLEQLSGTITIFRVRIAQIGWDRIFPGHEGEEEYLVLGTIEDVEVSTDPADEEDE